ncbi:hypothetical protein AVEN_75279-1 [Araneus ventricosus]|uniref:Uncharacterized protein n=1 Tax=Araneus ventricosus TaxID=182803 RepID=A0A4Y2NJ14_ARAVE|nr:hypothetical protein AVEN_75279-1 [Araneus ventricosus]
MCGLHGVTSVMPTGVPGTLNDSSCESSSTEGGVLVANSGHGLTSPKGVTYHYIPLHTIAHQREVTRPPPLLYSPGKRDPARRLLSHEFVVPTSESYRSCKNNWKIFTYKLKNKFEIFYDS